MPVSVYWPTSPALLRRLGEMQAAVRPGSRVLAGAKRDLLQIVRADHTDKMLRGVTRYGQPRAPLAASTLKDRRRGPGPSLIPRSMASRFITNFEVSWSEENGTPVLVGRYRDILSKQGKPFAQYHEVGAPRGSNPRRPNWSLPARPTMGITPQGWAQVIARHRQFAADVLRGGGGR